MSNKIDCLYLIAHVDILYLIIILIFIILIFYYLFSIMITIIYVHVDIFYTHILKFQLMGYVLEYMTSRYYGGMVVRSLYLYQF